MRLKSSKPFSDVYLFQQPDGTKKVEATIFQIPAADGAYIHSSLSIDGSNSMREMFGIGPFGGLNLVQPVVRGCGEFLASICDGKVSLHYWACGPDGSEIIDIGNLTQDEVSKIVINGPANNKWGKGTKLLPAMQRVVEGELKYAAWGMGVFITDGIWTDMEEVISYSLETARNIAEKKRGGLKLIIVGVGKEVDKDQMDSLNRLDFGNLKDPNTDTEIKLWDAMLAAEMGEIKDLIRSVLGKPVSAKGQVVDDKNNIVVNYLEQIPPKLDFVLPASAQYFTLKIGKKAFKQALA